MHSNRYTEFLLLLAEIESVKGEYDLASQYCLQASRLLECEPSCKQLLLTPSTSQGPPSEGERETVSKSPVKMASSDLFSDDDSFLDQVASLDIHTPPTSPLGSDTMKWTSPLHPIELHPQACLCSMCTNPPSLLHKAQLVVQCCSIALSQARDQLEKQCVSVDTPALMSRIYLVSSVLISLKEMVHKRIEKCDRVLEGVGVPETEQADHVTGTSSHVTGGRTNDKLKVNRSSHSAKGAQRRPKKCSKTTPQSTPEQTNHSIVKSPAFQCILASIVITKSECSILMERPGEAIKEVKSALSLLEEHHMDKELCLALAQLHFQMGVAAVQEVELNVPAVATELWEGKRKMEELDNDSTTTSRSRVKSSRKNSNRRTKASGTKSSSTNKHMCQDSQFSSALEHFVTCYQLCFPTLPAILTREVCQWVGLLVRGVGGAEEVVAHFVNAGMNCTLTHQTVYSLGKKIR